jgi:hypothetical protein
LTLRLSLCWRPSISVIGLVNLAERLLNEGSPQGQELPATPQATNTQSTNVTASPAGDLFTPSSQNGQAQNTAQEAGLFRVTQFSFFSAAADFLLGQRNGQPAAANVTTPNASSTQQTTLGSTLANTAAASLQTAGNASVESANGTANVAGTTTQVTTALAGSNSSNAANSNAAATAAAGPLATQQQLQALNTALAALGLTPQEIQQLDQIASVINDLNPTAFTSLANQLEQLAQAQAGFCPGQCRSNQHEQRTSKRDKWKPRRRLPASRVSDQILRSTSAGRNAYDREQYGAGHFCERKSNFAGGSVQPAG